MTDLEYLICEAESNGEINMSTRDDLLSVLESTRVSKEIEKYRNDSNKTRDMYENELRKLDNLIKKAYSSGNNEEGWRLTRNRDQLKKKYSAWKVSDKERKWRYGIDDKNHTGVKANGKKAALWKKSAEGSYGAKIANDAIQNGRNDKELLKRKFYDKGKNDKYEGMSTKQRILTKENDKKVEAFKRSRTS